MTDEVVEETEEQKAARIAALPRPIAKLADFRLSGIGDEVGGSQIILSHNGDKVTLGVTKGQTLGDDVVSRKTTIGSIIVSVKRDVRKHIQRILSGPEQRISEIKEHTILSGEEKMFGPIREQYMQPADPLGSTTYIDDENIYITLTSVVDDAGKPLDQDKSDPPPPPPKVGDFPWWIVGVGVTIAIIIVVALWAWKSGRLGGAAPAAVAPAPAPATVAAVPAVAPAAPGGAVK